MKNENEVMIEKVRILKNGNNIEIDTNLNGPLELIEMLEFAIERIKLIYILEG